MAYTTSNFVGTFWQVLSGDLYVSLTGSDTGGDGTPSLPYESIAKAVSEATTGQTIVIGAGVYHEALNFSGKSLKLRADGLVVLDGQGTLATALISAGAGSELYDLEVRGFTTSTIASHISLIMRCRIFGNSSTTQLALPTTSKLSLFHTVVLKDLGLGSIYSCTFIACTSTEDLDVETLKDTIFNETCQILFDHTVITYFDYCNHEPGALLRLNGVNYTSALSVHTAFSAFQTHGLSVMSGFVKPSIGNYALESNSPLLTVGSFTQYMGAYGTGIGIHRFGGLLDSIYFLQNMSIDSNSFVLEEDAASGSIETMVLPLGALKKLGMMALFADDVFETSPTSLTRLAQYSLFQPSMVCYEMKFGMTREDTDLSNYHTFLWNTIPKIDALGRGNGELDFDQQTARSVVAQFVKFKITVQSNQVFLVQENLDCLEQENGYKLIWKI